MSQLFQSLSQELTAFRRMRNDEMEMSINRMLLNLLVLTYFYICYRTGQQGVSDLLRTTYIALIAYTILGPCILAHILFFPEPLRTRRVFSIVLDLGMLSYVDHAGDQTTIFLYPLYLWVILGNGLRLGESYLLLATGIGLTFYSMVTFSGSFWHDHFYLSMGLLTGMVVLPIYVGVLIRKVSIAKQQAEEANRAKTLFLASVSHELRTPLTAILGLTDILKETPLTRDQMDLICTMESSSQILLRLINSLLEFSCYESGKSKTSYKKSTVDLYHLLADLQSMFHTQAAKKGLKLALQIDSKVPRFIFSSASYIQEIVTNLVANALKFTSKGHIIIQVVVVTQKEQLFLRFEIIDTGIGIAPEAQQRIFDRFTQADASILDRFGGTGLGLAICKELVESQGGRIGVDSIQGEGSTFWIDLKLEQEVEPLSEDAQLRQKQILNGMHILAINASEDVRQALEALGIQMSIADNEVEIHRIARLYGENFGLYPVVLIDERSVTQSVSELVAIVLKQSAFLSAQFIVLSQDESALLPLSDILCRLHWPAETTVFCDMLQLASKCFAEPQASKASAVGKGYKILVAEDNQTNQMVIGQILSRAGFSPQFVCNGEEALDALNREHFDAALMDVNMPVMNGLDAVRLYHFAAHKAERTPIFALTADMTPQMRLACLKAGMVDCLTKPIDTKELISVLCKAIKIDVNQANLHLVAKPEAAPEAAVDAAPPTSSSIDLAALDTLKSLGGDQFVSEVVTQFTDDAVVLLSTLVKAVKSHDLIAFRDQTHALRSCAASVGAHKIYTDCLAMRNISQSAFEQTGDAAIAMMLHEFDLTKAALLDYLSHLREGEQISSTPAAISIEGLSAERRAV